MFILLIFLNLASFIIMSFYIIRYFIFICFLSLIIIRTGIIVVSRLTILIISKSRRSTWHFVCTITLIWALLGGASGMVLAVGSGGAWVLWQLRHYVGV